MGDLPELTGADPAALYQRPNHRLPPFLALLGLALCAGAFRLRAHDLFWHLAAGRWMLTHHEIPRLDPFRFTATAEPWVDHEWLFQILVGATESLGGVIALGVLQIALVAALAAILYRAARAAGVSSASSTLVAGAALLGARARFLLRPELVTLVLFAIFLALLQRWRRRADPRTAVRLVALTVLWANVHAAALLAPPVAAAYALGTRLPYARGRRRQTTPLPWRWCVFLPLALALALLANPYGYQIALVPLRIWQAMRGLPGINPEWLPAWQAPQPSLLAGAAALVALLVAQRRRGGTIDAATGLVTGALAVLATLAVRHQAPFFIGAAFLAAETLADLEAGGVPRSPLLRRRLPALAVAGCVLAAAWCLWPPTRGPLRPRQGFYTPGFGLEPGRFPERAAEELRRRSEIGPLYHDVAWGGYLLWRLYPPRRVFWDLRVELDSRLLHAVAQARRDSRAWEALLRAYGVDAALLRYDERPRPMAAPGGGAVEHHTSSALYFPPESFALVYWDDAAMLFLRRTASRAVQLAREEYRFVQPEDWRATLDRAAGDPAARAGALAEVERRLNEDPSSVRARRLQAELRALPPASP